MVTGKRKLICLFLILAIMCGVLMMSGCWRASACGLHDCDTGIWASTDGNIVLTILPVENRPFFPSLVWGYIRNGEEWQEVMVLCGITGLLFFDSEQAYRYLANTAYCREAPQDNLKVVLDISVTSFPSETAHSYIVDDAEICYQPRDRITFVRNEQAQPQYSSPCEWMKKNNRPVDSYGCVLKTETGDSVLQVGHAPLIFAGETVNGEQIDFFLMRVVENGTRIFRAYPMDAVDLIGTDKLEATSIGFWTWAEPDENIDPEEPVTNPLHGFMAQYTWLTKALYDPDAKMNVIANKIGYYSASDYVFYELPNTEWENEDGTRSIRIGDPATMTGTMTIDGEVVDITWVMEDYYHSDIVRVYRTADYESEDFSAEDDLLCRMKVRCTDARHTAYVATVVGDGVFPDGTSWTYRKEI